MTPREKIQQWQNDHYAEMSIQAFNALVKMFAAHEREKAGAQRCRRCGGALPVTGRHDRTGECDCQESGAQALREAADKWVLVTEQMPKSGQIVLALQKWDHSGKLGIIRAAWVAAKTEESSPESDIGEYDEATDTYYDPEGWYEQISHWDEISAAGISGATIVAWMPLPAIDAALRQQGGQG